MRTAQTDPQFDRIFQLLDKPLPASAPMTDPKFFLSVNEGAILHRLGESKREQQRITLTRFSTVFGVFTAFAMLLTFSRDARAFVHDVLYTVVEWFSPEQNESGVTFDIQDSTHSDAPSLSQVDVGEKTGFEDVSEVDKLYSGKIFIVGNGDFAFSDGYIRDNIICLNYNYQDSHVQIISEPIQSSGSVTYHFNDTKFDKKEISDLGTFYHTIQDDGTLFGGIMTNDTCIIVSADKASPDLLDLIANSICRYR